MSHPFFFTKKRKWGKLKSMGIFIKGVSEKREKKTKKEKACG